MWIIDFLVKILIKLRLKRWQEGLILHLIMLFLDELKTRTNKELDISLIENIKKLILERLTKLY